MLSLDLHCNLSDTIKVKIGIMMILYNTKAGAGILKALTVIAPPGTIRHYKTENQ